MNWIFKVLTLGCRPINSHTGQGVSDYVKELLKEFFGNDYMKMVLSCCHDGAANMRKASQLIRVDEYQHCVAHALNLLLTTDSLNKVGEINGIVEK